MKAKSLCITKDKVSKRVIKRNYYVEGTATNIYTQF